MHDCNSCCSVRCGFPLTQDFFSQAGVTHECECKCAQLYSAKLDTATAATATGTHSLANILLDGPCG